MNVFDLHCDTVSTCIAKRKNFLKNDLHIGIDRGIEFDKWIQTFAFWIPDTLRGEAAYNNFIMQHKFISDAILENGDKLEIYSKRSEINRGKCYCIFAIEGGAALAGKIDNVAELKNRDVAMMTLCWNDDNEIAGGTYGNGRLTKFGVEVIEQMESNNIIVDVSHLNYESFFDICRVAKKPFIATHSNSFEVFEHKRNLDKAQIKEIINIKGLVGINFYTAFVNKNENYTLEDLLSHIDYILKLGGENILSLGSDFDGADMPECLDRVEKLIDLKKLLVSEYGQELAEKILFGNAEKFMKINM